MDSRLENISKFYDVEHVEGENRKPDEILHSRATTSDNANPNVIVKVITTENDFCHVINSVEAKPESENSTNSNKTDFTSDMAISSLETTKLINSSTDSTVGHKDISERPHNNHNPNLNPSGSIPKAEFVSVHLNVQQQENESRQSEAALPDTFQNTALSSANPKQIMGKVTGDIYYIGHEILYHESHNCLQRNTIHDCLEREEGNSCISSELQVMSDNGDSKHSPQKFTAPVSRYSSYYPYNYPTSRFNDQTGHSSHMHQNCKHTNTDIQINMKDEFQMSQYEKTESSTVFSSVESYQKLDQSYSTGDASLSQDDNECHQDLIIDLDSQTCRKSVSQCGSEALGCSLSYTESSEFCQNDWAQQSYSVSLSDHFTFGWKSMHSSSVLLKSETQQDTPTKTSMQSNTTPFSDPGMKWLNPVQEGCQTVSDEHYKSATATLNSEGFHYSLGDKLSSDFSMCDSYFSDNSKNYHSCDNYLYQAPYRHTSATYCECNQWVKQNDNPYDTLSPPGTANTNMCSVSSSDIRDDVTTPEVVQFLEMEDEEETDDADEIDYLRVSFNIKNDQQSDHMGLEPLTIDPSLNNTSDESYSLSVLTPPPSVSSTPVSSSSYDNYSYNETGFHIPLQTAQHDSMHVHGSSETRLPPYKLRREQLEESLLSFGLNPNTKHFPSMADALRSSHSKPASQKKSAHEAAGQQPKRSGRPPKTQIQSDKISTTATGSKQKKKSTAKSKCERLLQDSAGLIHSHGDSLETVSSRMPGAIRHNEPLNQRAVEIMSRWFEDHIDNPYPNKADKEEMARQGCITENQVKSWFANKRNRTNNTKPKVQRRAMEEKLRKLFRDLKRNHHNPMADNSHIIQQLSGIIQHCQSAKEDC